MQPPSPAQVMPSRCVSELSQIWLSPNLCCPLPLTAVALPPQSPPALCPLVMLLQEILPWLQSRLVSLGIARNNLAFMVQLVLGYFWVLSWGFRPGDAPGAAQPSLNHKTQHFPLPRLTNCLEKPPNLSSEMLLQTNKKKKLNKSKFNCPIYPGEKAKLKWNWQTRSFLFISV